MEINTCTEESPCENGATCTNEDMTYSCACAEGYTGFHCQKEIANCAGDPCQNDVTCPDGVNGFNCTGATGFDGKDKVKFQYQKNIETR